MEHPPKPYPFGLEGAGSAYQNVVHHLFIDHVKRDHITDLYMIDPTNSYQPTPMINMVATRQLLDDPSLLTKSLHNVLIESPDDYSKGSTKTVSSCPTFPLGFGGMIFHVGHDSVTKDGETAEEHEARLVKNVDRQRCRDTEATQEVDEDGRGPPRHQCNLEEAFDMVGDQSTILQAPI